MEKLLSRFVLVCLIAGHIHTRYSSEGGHKSELSQPKAKHWRFVLIASTTDTHKHTLACQQETHTRTNTRTVSEGLTSGHVVIGDFHGAELQAFRLVRRAQHHVYKHSGRCLNTH